MKTNFKYIVFLLLSALLVSCETTDLSILDDPNQPEFGQADVNRYLHAIQKDFSFEFMRRAGDEASAVTRINYMNATNYNTAFAPSSQDRLWRKAYHMMLDMKAAEASAEEQGLLKHIVVIDILKAYGLITLVDLYGDVPYTEANNPTDFPFPNVDNDEDVYNEALTLLDNAINLIDNSIDGSKNLDNDLFYDNNFTKWKKLANTIKMYAYLNMRLVDPTAVNKFNAIVASGDYISSTNDDFQFQFGSRDNDPDTRHPSYAQDYTATGAGSYRSNWLMGTMLDLGDPRISLYFYRQSPCTPGNVSSNGDPCEPNLEQLRCSTVPRPSHYPPSMVYCSLPNGYWGRDHMNSEGTPPDGKLRTITGVYPAGGKFDMGFFIPGALGAGGGGAGVQPLMLASWVQFMIAEVRLLEGNPAAAQSAIEQGISLSGNKAITFADLDPSTISAFVPTTSAVSAYASQIGSDFNAANNEGKWEILATQKFIAHYGNGLAAYDFYRRTGYPKDLQLPLKSDPGIFIRSFYYPSNEVNANSNITQKNDVGQKVFWDTNPDSPQFPIAN